MNNCGFECTFTNKSTRLWSNYRVYNGEKTETLKAWEVALETAKADPTNDFEKNYISFVGDLKAGNKIVAVGSPNGTVNQRL